MASKKKAPRRVKRIKSAEPPVIPATMEDIRAVRAGIDFILGKVNATSSHVGSQGDRIRVLDERLREMELSPNWLKDLVSKLDSRASLLEQQVQETSRRIDSMGKYSSGLHSDIEGLARGLDGILDRERERLKLQMAQAHTVKPNLFERFVAWLNKDAKPFCPKEPS